MKTTQLFPGIIEKETNDGQSLIFTTYKNREEIYKSKKYKDLLKKLSKASIMINDAYQLICEVKDSVPFSDGKSEMMTLEEMASLDKTPEEIMERLLGLS